MPLFMHIIDDVAGLAIDWAPEATRAWYHWTRKVLTLNLLPIAEPKSCPIREVESTFLDFIGCEWNLEEMAIYPAATKLETITKQVAALLDAKTAPKQAWERIVGRLVWLATFKRPLLACTQSIFRETRDMHQEQTLIISQESKKEMRTLVALLQSARVELALPLSQMVIAFDASQKSGAVTFARIPADLAELLWCQAQQVRFSRSLLQPENLPAMEPALKSYVWRKALVHDWRTPEHINGLEAATAVLSLEWAVRGGLRNTKVLMLTDSLATLGALRKGKSSAPGMLVRCRRFAALSLAHQVRVTFAYVKSKENPLDKYTRLP